MLLICIIQKLTDTPSSSEDNGGRKEDAPDPSPEVGSALAPASAAHQDIFYASSCAALFLRLICPAIISPLEWGALRVPTVFQRPSPQPASASAAPQVNQREAARTVMFGKTFSSSEMNISSKPIRHSFVPSLLLKRGDSIMQGGGTSVFDQQSQHSQQPPSEEELKSINAMDQNPAVAAIILVAHLLSSIEVNFLEESQQRELLQLIQTVVRTVPLQKLEVYLQRYEEKTRSLVDPSTQTAFESPQTKRALLIFARAVQKIANLSIVNHELVEVPVPLPPPSSLPSFCCPLLLS
jgi:hypothetical protein